MKNPEKRKGSTIRSIAKEAGVSISTVSRVINRPEMTSELMRNKVLPVIKKYGYVPNLMAKNLYSQQSNTVAIFVYDMMNPFFLSIIKELNRVALRHQYNLIICDTENDKEQEHAYYEYCKAIRCSGIVLTEGVNYIDELIARDRGMESVISPHIVSLDRSVNDEIPMISSENVSGGKAAVEYLISLGHKKIGFAGFLPHMSSIEDRFNGYSQALTEASLFVEKHYTFRSPSLRTIDGVHIFDDFARLSDRPTAIFCSNDQIAKGFVMRAAEKGCKVPRDCSIIGFDGVMTYDMWPRLTTMRQNIPEMSEALFRCITRDNQNGREYRFETNLINGQTCAAI